MTSRIDTLLDIIGTKKPIGDLKEDVDKILINRDEYDYLRLNELKNKSIECLEVALEV